jgi:hypothetical protein
MAGIFISYRRKDAGGYAGRLHQDLVERYGRDAVFMDIDSIRGGADFKERIHDALDSSDIALVLIGENWTAPGRGPEAVRRIDDEDDLVRREVAAALRDETVTVLPILIEETDLPPTNGLPADLSSLPDLQTGRLRNSEWRTDSRRIFREVDAAMDEPGVKRLVRRLRDVPVGLPVAVLALLLVAAVVAALSLSGGEDTPQCTNRPIPADVREPLAKAAQSDQPAVDGSVYYGTCGTRTWALASFPNGSDGVFVESGLKWVDLGPIAANKCTHVPAELLDLWTQNDC